MYNLVTISKNLLLDCLGAKPNENYMIDADDYNREIIQKLIYGWQRNRS